MKVYVSKQDGSEIAFQFFCSEYHYKMKYICLKKVVFIHNEIISKCDPFVKKLK